MSSRQRNLVIAVAAVVLVVVGVLAVALRKDDAEPAATGASSTATTTTSTGPVPTSTTQPMAWSGGALLVPPQEPTVREGPAPDKSSCRFLYDEGFDGSCDVIAAPTGTMMWVQEEASAPTASAPREQRLLVYTVSGTTYSLALRYVETITGQSRVSSFRTSNIAADDDPKAVALFTQSDTNNSSDATLRAVEVIEATGQVVLHRDLSFGYARHATGGGLETWSRNDGTSPLTYRHEVIRYRDGAWRVEQGEDVAATDVPVDEVGSF